MASKKKQSEGIALLSMYKDEDDDEMEDVEEDEYVDAEMRGQHQQDAAEEDLATDADRMAVGDSGNEAADTPTEKSRFGESTPQQLVSPQDQRLVSSDTRVRKREKLTIVDYGHDEVAMSPEPEEGEIGFSGRVMIGDHLHVTNGDFLDKTPSGTFQVLTPSNQANTQFSEPLKSDTVNNDAMIRSDDAETGEADHDDEKSVDPLDKFLPPPPKAKCSEELQI